MRHLSIDIETFSSVDLKKSGLYRYVQSPDFEIMLFAYSFDGGVVKIIDLTKDTMPYEIIQALADPTVIKHAFNATFEWYCLNKYWRSPLEQWHCTMFHSLYCGFTTSLGSAAEAVGLPAEKKKSYAGNALIKVFCVPTKPSKANGQRTRTFPHHEPEKWELFKDYCTQDVVAEMALENKLKNFPVPDLEQHYWVLDQIMNCYGVRVDMNLVEGALMVSDVTTKALMSEAMLLTKLDNPNSVKQLCEWLTSEMEEEVTELTKSRVKWMLERAVPQSNISRVLEIRLELAKTSVKKYQAIQKVVCADGRVRGLLQFYGANRTGRWAGRLVQMQNLPKNYLSNLDLAREMVKAKKVDMVGILFGNVPDTLSQLIRTAFVPSEGCRLTVADFSAIEARVLAWLAGEKWVMDVFAGDGKIYEACASRMFGIPLETIKKGQPNYKYRQYGKVATLALGYQGGVGALTSMGALDMGIPEKELQDIVDKWRVANPHIVKYWGDLQSAVIQCIQNGTPGTVGHVKVAKVADHVARLCFLTIELPSGRKLYYSTPRLTSNKWGGLSIAYSGMNQNTKKWAVLETYGGKLCENIVQAVARDCLAVAVDRLTAHGFRIVSHVHDEVLVETPENADLLENVCGIMSLPIPWASGLLLTADGFTGNYYKKEG